MPTTAPRPLVVTAGAAVLTAVAALGAALPADAAPSVLYVSPTGSDSAAGTEAAPKRTPQAAVDALGPDGGVVRLATGRYGSRVEIVDRSHVTVEPAPGAVPVLDGAGLTVPADRVGMVEVTDSSDVVVRGLEITGWRTTSVASVPVGILVTGGGAGVRLESNHVHHLGNDNGTRGSMEMNAHGIAVYGTDTSTPLSDVDIVGNEVDHVVLGASEAVVVNGNVDGWTVTGNHVHHADNIGIDAIGYEGTVPRSVRYTDVNRARNGVISDNLVTDIVTRGNPAYWDGDGWCNCAGGIYVDGGRSITISGNTITRADIGIEVAAEDHRGTTNDITVTGNTITESAWVGLAIGGYDSSRGSAHDVLVNENTLRGNNTLNDGSPEVLLQYKVHDTQIVDNSITSTHPDYAVLVSRVPRAGSAAENRNVVLDRNDYGAPVAASEAVFFWAAPEIVGFARWQTRSGQDRASTFTTR